MSATDNDEEQARDAHLGVGHWMRQHHHSNALLNFSWSVSQSVSQSVNYLRVAF